MNTALNCLFELVVLLKNKNQFFLATLFAIRVLEMNGNMSKLGYDNMIKYAEIPDSLKQELLQIVDNYYTVD